MPDGALRETSAGGLTIRACADIADVDPDEWDSLSPPGDLQATHRFIRTCQESRVEDARYRHLMVYRGGELQAVATLSVLRVSLELLAANPARVLVARIRRLHRSFLRLRLVLCGLPVSFNRSCIRFRPGVEVGPLVQAVAAEAEALAAEEDAPVVCFKEHTAAEAEELQPLLLRGYFRAPSLPSCQLDLRWRSFDELVADMRAGYRRLLQASLTRGERTGLQVRVVDDLRCHCRRIFPLYEQVMDRAEFQLERLPAAFFDRLAENLSGETRVILAEHGERLLAAAVLLVSEEETTFLLAGIDYAANRRHHAYFNLVAEVVAEAVRAGAPRLEMGQTSYELKGRMGARLTERYLFLKHRSAVWHRLLRTTSRWLFPVMTPTRRRVFKDPGG